MVLYGWMGLMRRTIRNKWRFQVRGKRAHASTERGDFNEAETPTSTRSRSRKRPASWYFKNPTKGTLRRHVRGVVLSNKNTGATGGQGKERSEKSRKRGRDIAF